MKWVTDKTEPSVFTSLVHSCSVNMLGTSSWSVTLCSACKKWLFVHHCQACLNSENCRAEQQIAQNLLQLTRSLYCQVVSSSFECLQVIIPKKGDIYQDGCDLNQLLGHTHISPSPEKCMNKSLWVGYQEVRQWALPCLKHELIW